MKQVITTERLPIKMWLDNAEDGAIEQAKHLANLPFAVKHIVLLPDTHQGYGMPIGGVLATHGVVVPNAVGVDVSCGVIASKLINCMAPPLPHTLKKIMGKIRGVIPVGMTNHKLPCSVSDMPDVELSVTEIPIVSREFEKARKAMGTLGGGNHFIEIQEDREGFWWIMIHSGSRNLGKQVADHYNKVAAKLNEKYYSTVDKSWELAFLPLDSEEGQAYLREMNYCVKYAEANRKRMMSIIKGIFISELGYCDFEDDIHVNHNYARMEHHYGQNVLVHRKGATSAKEGELGLIPGSQGTKSYVVKGLGNKESFMSCSHGAGRAMGRKEAQRRLILEDEIKRLDDQGIIHSIRTEKDLDEAAGSYKDISVVMQNQADLVEIIAELSPKGVVKG